MTLELKCAELAERRQHHKKKIKIDSNPRALAEEYKVVERAVIIIRSQICEALREKYKIAKSGKQLIYKFNETRGLELDIFTAEAMTEEVFGQFLRDGYGFLLTALHIRRPYQKQEWLLSDSNLVYLPELTHLRMDEHKGNLKKNFSSLFKNPFVAQLEYLSLRGNQLGVDEAKIIANADLARLETLLLDLNPLRDAGAQALAASTKLDRLRTLGLKACGIHPPGLAAINIKSESTWANVKVDLSLNYSD